MWHGADGYGYGGDMCAYPMLSGVIYGFISGLALGCAHQGWKKTISSSFFEDDDEYDVEGTDESSPSSSDDEESEDDEIQKMFDDADVVPASTMYCVEEKYQTEEEILAVGINIGKEPINLNTNVPCSNGFVRMDHIGNNKPSVFLRLTPHEERKIIGVFEEKGVKGMPYHEAEKLVERYDYKLHPVLINGKPNPASRYDGSVLGVSVIDPNSNGFALSENAFVHLIKNVGGYN